jgi:hypothetical protein
MTWTSSIATPRGCRKNWDRSNIGRESAEHFLKDYGGGNLTEAVAWFDENDAMRVLVAVTADGKQITFRKGKRQSSVSIAPHIAARPQPVT